MLWYIQHAQHVCSNHTSIFFLSLQLGRYFELTVFPQQSLLLTFAENWACSIKAVNNKNTTVWQFNHTPKTKPTLIRWNYDYDEKVLLFLLENQVTIIKLSSDLQMDVLPEDHGLQKIDNIFALIIPRRPSEIVFFDDKKSQLLTSSVSHATELCREIKTVCKLIVEGIITYMSFWNDKFYVSKSTEVFQATIER